MSEFVEKYINPSTNINRHSKAEAEAYEDSLKSYRDLKNSLDTAREEGREEGRKKGREAEKQRRDREIVQNALAQGLSIETIVSISALTREAVEKLIDEK